MHISADPNRRNVTRPVPCGAHTVQLAVDSKFLRRRNAADGAYVAANVVDELVKGDYKKYSEADYEFHLAIVRASHNSVFYNVMNSIKDIYYYYLEELNRALGITLESVEAHIKVYMSIKNRDASTAVKVLDEAMSGNIIAIEKIKSTETSGTK